VVVNWAVSSRFINPCFLKIANKVDEMRSQLLLPCGLCESPVRGNVSSFYLKELGFFFNFT